MKKILAALLCVGMLLVGVFAGCGTGKSDEGGEASLGVNLVALSGAVEVGVRDVDYYVVPEPAASTRVNAIPALQFSGSLQDLYGSADGYPQAVLVAKKSLIESDGAFVNAFIDVIKENSDWLLDTDTEATTIVSAVSSHLTDGMTPTFNANNLTKQVITNSGIKYISATDAKSSIISFMASLNSVADTSFGTPSEEFFATEIANTSSASTQVSVYMPDGAPALSLAKLMNGEGVSLSKTVNYEVVEATTIASYVSGGSPTADMCVLPVNLATRLLGTGATYQLLGTMTNGNLYLVSSSGETISSANIMALRGKTVGVVNLAAVPGLTFKLILKNNNIEYTELV